jgi:hypothetical protein
LLLEDAHFDPTSPTSFDSAGPQTKDSEKTTTTKKSYKSKNREESRFLGRGGLVFPVLVPELGAGTG